jgi:Flp pilus assembly protein TadD
MLPVTLTWLRVLFLPVALSADYSPLHIVPETSLGVNHVFALFLWVCLLTLTYLLRDKLRALFVGVLLFLVTISVVSNIVVPLEVLMAERLLLLPSFGWAVAVAGAIWFVYQQTVLPVRRKAIMVSLGVILFLFAGRSIHRAGVWRSNDTFFAALAEDAPNSFRSHWAAGHFAFERGDSALGESELLTAVRLNSEHPQLLEDFGRLYASTGRYEPAVPLLSHAVAIDSTRLSSALPLALALARLGRAQEALAVVDNMTMRHGDTRGILLVRGEVLMRDRRFAEAVEALMGLVKREPDVWSVRLMAAEAALEAGECELALAQADTALNLAPESEKATVREFRARVANGNANCK